MSNQNRRVHMLNGKQLIRQLVASEVQRRGWIEELLAFGYTWDAKKGCWVHEDGTELWEDS